MAVQPEVAAAYVPDAERLAKNTKAWLSMMKEGLPVRTGPHCGGAGDGKTGPRHPGPGPLAAAGRLAGTPGPRDAAGGAVTPDAVGAGEAGPDATNHPRQPEPLLSPTEMQVAANLDRFFDDEKIWQQVADEVKHSTGLRRADCVKQVTFGGSSTFRVVVPKQYPGIQYRKSKSLNDRYQRYAKLGSIVTGQVEDSGEWLRISNSVFLPMRVGTVQVLEPVSPDEAERIEGSRASRAGESDHPWWICGPVDLRGGGAT